MEIKIKTGLLKSKSNITRIEHFFRSGVEPFIIFNQSFRNMKRSTVLIGFGVIVLGIVVLGGLSLTGSESAERTIPIVESDSQKHETSASNSMKCSSDAFGRMVCSPYLKYSSS